MEVGGCRPGGIEGLALNPTHKDLALNGTGVRLNFQFRDFLVDLPPGIRQPIRFRIRTSTNSTNEEIAFDSLRLIGETIPPTADSDGDGVSGLFESIQGTDPHDAKADSPSAPSSMKAANSRPRSKT